MRTLPRGKPRLGPLSSSWVVLTGVLIALVGIGLSALLVLAAQARQQHVLVAVDEAELITQATAGRDAGIDVLGRPFSAAEVADLTGDVRQLSAGNHLLGLTILRLDGTPLFTDGVAAPLPRSAGAVVVPAKAYVSSFRTGTGVEAIGVVMPLDVNADGAPDLLTGVTVPTGSVADVSRRSSIELGAAVTLALVATAIGLLSLRRRVRRREYDAHHDPTTGLGNRLLLEREATAQLDAGLPCGLLVMDLDGFKRVNDTLGHAAGDDLLVLVADALRAAVRPGDRVVRLGGDEFAVLLAGMAPEGVESAARRLLTAVQNRFAVRGVDLDVEASIGAVAAPHHGTTIGVLLQAADVAMYRAKRGKLGYWMFDEGDSTPDGRDLKLLIDLRTAITDRTLHLNYQPTVSLRPGVPAFVEALARWDHPEHGSIPPDRFIPLAEDTALIHPLTEWVLDEAVGQCAAWRLDGMPTMVAVNISPHSLMRPGLVELVTDTLARHQLPASALHLEITETAIIARPEIAHEVLGRLAARGITLSIDDFGAGYTSLAHLQTLPMHTLKIDRQFVQHLTGSRPAASIVAATIGLGHGLDMQVVAEGVEDAETLAMLAAMGCDIAQGYHISRPLTGPLATTWLREHPVAPIDWADLASPG